LKVLAVSGRKRFAATPNTPTMIESGFADFEAIAWIGFLAPGATPRPVIERYNRELVRILNSPEVRQKLLDIQFEIVAGTPEQFAEYIRWETPRWAKVIRDTGAKANN
jgi:tripartite-type tricarboxylate transporter receptor subunit TctC